MRVRRDGGVWGKILACDLAHTFLASCIDAQEVNLWKCCPQSSLLDPEFQRLCIKGHSTGRAVASTAPLGHHVASRNYRPVYTFRRLCCPGQGLFRHNRAGRLMAPY